MMKNVLLLLLTCCSLSSFGQIINFPDANFKNALVNTKCVDTNNDGTPDADADLNNDGEIDKDEALKVINLFVLSKSISKLDGIENFKEIAKLNCSGNNIQNLNLKPLSKLSVFDAKEANLRSLLIDSMPSLTIVRIEENANLLELNISENNNLEYISLHNMKNKGKVKFINTKGCLNLKYLNFNQNSVESIDLSTSPLLEILYASYNNLANLDLSKNKLLKEVTLEHSSLKKLDLSNQFDINIFNVIYNKLDTLYIKNGRKEIRRTTDSASFLEGNSSLKYICCDDFQISEILKATSFINCEVNSYCSFKPGGKYYTINGNAIFDFNNNGCDFQDRKAQYVKFNISSDTISGSIFSNNKGSYSISLQDGTHTITPIIENPDHFVITPSSLTVTFPNISDTITQNFCITPKGIFRQTNITVLPLTPPARSGFNASYKIVWENVGNQIESGTLNFTYDETLLDYISATQTADQVADGIVKWNFANLLPFEKREITVTLRVNRPTDTPVVNAGDKLYLNASILDNIFTLENTVVGSYDPNDKTCLQGDRIKPDMIGKYVDYLIRFENTGNYAAENVVIKDIIDTKTFDVSTLKITDASHELYTRIEGNKVEFIFENIQLPFDDANNDGYVAFKIKTLPSLVLGDSLKNLADIYFDYNFPIRTNEAQTTVALPVFTKDITTEVNIYPNPVKDILYLDTNENWTKAEIFDIAGRIMRSVSLYNQSIDVSVLESGTYFVRLKDGEKVGMVKFVKI